MQMILTRLPKVEDMTRTVTHSAAFITIIARWALIRVNKLMRVCFDYVTCYELMSEKRQLSLLNFSNKRPCREDIQEKALSSSSHNASVITEKNCEVSSSTSCITAAADSDSGDSRYSYYS